MSTLMEKIGSGITILAMSGFVGAIAFGGFAAYQESPGTPLLLSCVGKTTLWQEPPETFPDTMSITLDIKTQTVRVDDREPLAWINPKEDIWNFNSFRTYSPGQAYYSGTINRITGATDVLSVPAGSGIFNGICKPTQRLF